MAAFGDGSFLTNPKYKPYTPSLEVQVPSQAFLAMLDPGFVARDAPGREKSPQHFGMGRAV